MLDEGALRVRSAGDTARSICCSRAQWFLVELAGSEATRRGSGFSGARRVVIATQSHQDLLELLWLARCALRCSEALTAAD
jgi:hypothetical protein